MFTTKSLPAFTVVVPHCDQLNRLRAFVNAWTTIKPAPLVHVVDIGSQNSDVIQYLGKLRQKAGVEVARLYYAGRPADVSAVTATAAAFDYAFSRCLTDLVLFVDLFTHPSTSKSLMELEKVVRQHKFVADTADHPKHYGALVVKDGDAASVVFSTLVLRHRFPDVAAEDGVTAFRAWVASIRAAERKVFAYPASRWARKMETGT